jgi:hypothetical protein
MTDDNPRDAYHKEDGRQKNSDPTHNTEPLIVTIEPQTKNKYSYDAKHYRLDRARYILEKKSYRTSHWTMVFLIVYTGLTLIVAISSVVATCVAHEQVELMRQQLSGTIGALITAEFGITPQDPPSQLEVSLTNAGHIASHNLHGSFKISEISVPSQKTIKTFLPWEFNVPVMPSEKTSSPNPQYPLALSTEEAVASGRTEIAFKVDGRLTYDNGFTQITDAICYCFVGSYGVKDAGGHIDHYGPFRSTCDEFPVYIQTVLTERHKKVEH